jgi:hypothetical protein
MISSINLPRSREALARRSANNYVYWLLPDKFIEIFRQKFCQVFNERMRHRRMIRPKRLNCELVEIDSGQTFQAGPFQSQRKASAPGKEINEIELMGVVVAGFLGHSRPSNHSFLTSHARVAELATAYPKLTYNLGWSRILQFDAGQPCREAKRFKDELKRTPLFVYSSKQTHSESGGGGGGFAGLSPSDRGV